MAIGEYPKVTIKLNGKVNVCDTTISQNFDLSQVRFAFSGTAPVLIDHFPKGQLFSNGVCPFKGFAA